MSAADQSPIKFANVSLWAVGFVPVQQLENALTNEDGAYSLTYFIADFCGEDLYSISASRRSYQTVGYYTNDSIHVRCTEDLQTIDFNLPREEG